MKQEIDKEWLARNFNDIVNDYSNIYDSLPKEKVAPLVLAADIITKYALIQLCKERTKKAWKKVIQEQIIAEIKNYKRFFTDGDGT